MKATTKVILVVGGIVGLLVSLVVLMVTLMVLEPLWWNPPQPTSREVHASDIAGTYRYSRYPEVVDINLILRVDGTFTQTVTFKHGQPAITINDRWKLVNKAVVLDSGWCFRRPLAQDMPSLPAEELGRFTTLSWKVVDSGYRKDGFALFGSDTVDYVTETPCLLERQYQ